MKGAPTCCGRPVDWLVAESTYGGQSWRLWRCSSCESFHRYLWHPPVWINRTAEIFHRLMTGFGEAVSAAYTVPDEEPIVPSAATPDVVLFAGDNARAEVYQAIAIDDEGAFVLVSRERGEVPWQLLGESEYEFRIRVAANHKAAVLHRLHQALRVEPDGQTVDDELLTLVSRAYGGNANASLEFQRWLDTRRIPYSLESHSS